MKVELVETTYSDAPKVDREAGVIRGVKIIGRVSKNGYEYTESALQECATAYDGLGVNVNHPDRKTPGAERSVEARFGWLESVTVKPDGVYGDMHYAKAHPQAGLITELAERNPRMLGLSHNASGQAIERGGKRFVESVNNVRSVDIVQKPATTTGLFESENPMKKVTLKQLVESVSPKAKLRKGLIKLLEMDGEMGAMMAPEGSAAEEAMPDESNPDDQATDAFVAMIAAVLTDDTLDVKAKKAKIMKLVQTHSDLTAPETPTPPAEGDTPVEESAKDKTDPQLKTLMEEVATLKAEKAHDLLRAKCSTLLESSGVEATEIRIKGLMACSEADRKDLIESWPKAEPKRVPKPARSVSVMESEAELPKGEKFIAALKRN